MATLQIAASAPSTNRFFFPFIATTSPSRKETELKLNASWLPRPVLFGSGRANQSGGPRLDDVRELAQILRSVPHVLQELVDIFRVCVECAVQLTGQLLQLCKILPQFHQRAMNLGFVFRKQLVDMVNRFVCFG